jgi:hypothetical protein
VEGSKAATPEPILHQVDLWVSVRRRVRLVRWGLCRLGDVSFGVFLQRFMAGKPARADPETVLGFLEPFISRREPEHGDVEVRTSDGTADVYGMNDPGASLMVNHASGQAIWTLLFELAAVTDLVVMPVGCGTCITRATTAADLADGIPEPITVIHSGADLLTAVSSP